MNCKPGDLAILVKVIYPEDRKFLGCVVKVLQPGGPDDSFFYWAVEHPKLVEVPDDFMKPLRDSGGTDETLLWKETPKPTNKDLLEQAVEETKAINELLKEMLK